MTQVLSVSANTAAYALEAVKPSQRVSRRSEVEEAIHELARKAEQGDDFQLRALLTAIKPPALTLYFLTSASHRNAPRQHSIRPCRPTRKTNPIKLIISI